MAVIQYDVIEDLNCYIHMYACSAKEIILKERFKYVYILFLVKKIDTTNTTYTTF